MNSKYDAQPPGPWTAEWSNDFEEWVVLDAEGKLICWANGENPRPILMTDAPALAARVEVLEAALKTLIDAAITARLDLHTLAQGEKPATKGILNTDIELLDASISRAKKALED